MFKKAILGLVVGGSIIAGSVIGFKIATDDEFRGAVKQSFRQARFSSRHRIDALAENIALKKAKITRNPKVNQEWVAKQWSDLK